MLKQCYQLNTSAFVNNVLFAVNCFRYKLLIAPAVLIKKEIVVLTLQEITRNLIRTIAKSLKIHLIHDTCFQAFSIIENGTSLDMLFEYFLGSLGAPGCLYFLIYQPTASNF